MSATLNLKTLKCIRRHDLTGVDEAEIWIGGRKYWATTMDKDQSKTVPDSEAPYLFTGSVKVALYEASGRAGHVDKKQIGTAFTVTETNPPLSPMEFKTTGAHYTLTFSVDAATTAGATGAR